MLPNDAVFKRSQGKTADIIFRHLISMVCGVQLARWNSNRIVLIKAVGSKMPPILGTKLL